MNPLWRPRILHALPTVVLCAILAGSSLVLGKGFTPGQRLIAVIGLALTLAILLTVAIQCLSHRDGVWDWKNGGVAYVTRSDRTRLAWCDWAILVSRHGLLHSTSGRLRVERRALCGLFSLGADERVLSADDQVRVGHEEVMQWERAPDAFGEYRSVWNDDRYALRRQHFDHVVALKQEGEEPLLLLDLASGNDVGESSAFVEKFGRLVTDALAAIPPRRPAG